MNLSHNTCQRQTYDHPSLFKEGSRVVKHARWNRKQGTPNWNKMEHTTPAEGRTYDHPSLFKEGSRVVNTREVEQKPGIPPNWNKMEQLEIILN